MYSKELKILVIEDNEYDFELIKLQLSNFINTTFVLSSTYEKFKEEFYSSKFDVIFCDYNINGYSGFDILKEVRKVNTDIPVFIISGNIEEAKAVELLSNGATDYVIKENLNKLSISLYRVIKEKETIRSEQQNLSALRASEERYKILIENMNDGILFSNFNGTIQFVNNKFCDMFGYTESELIGKNGYEIFFKGDTKEIIANKADERKTIKSEIYDTIAYNKAGQKVLININASAVMQNKEPIGIMALIKNITLEKNQEKILNTIFKSLSVQTGNSYFSELSNFCFQQFKAEHVIIGEYLIDSNEIATISFRINGKINQNITYNLKDTPCDLTIKETIKICIYNDAVEHFDKDEYIQKHNLNHYIGIKLKNEKNEVIGIIALLSSKPLEYSENNAYIFDLIENRASSELDRFITKKKLQESEEQFRMMVENSTDLISIATLKGDFIYASPNVEKILGYSFSEIKQSSIFTFLLKDVLAEANQNLEDIIQEKNFNDGIVHKLRLKDNSLRVFNTYAQKIKTPKGQDVILLNTSDITEKHYSDKKIKQSDEILNRISTFVLVVNRDGNVTYVSPSIEKALGFRKDELIGKGWWFKTTETSEQAQLEHDLDIKLIKSSSIEKNRHYERQITTQFGTKIWIGWENSIAPNGDLIGVGQDITNRKEHETKLLDSEAFSQSILSALHASIAVINEEGVIISTNQTWDDFTNSNDGQLINCGIGINYLEVCKNSMREENDAYNANKGILSVLTGKKFIFEMEYPCHSPTEKRWFSMRITPFKGKSGGAVITHYNITEKKLQELEVQKSNELFRAITESSPLYIFIIDTNYTIQYTNIINHSKFDFPLLNSSILDFLDADFIDIGRNKLKAVFKTGEVREHNIKISPSIMEEEKWFNIIAGPIVNENGEIKSLVILANDISQTISIQKEREKLILDLSDKHNEQMQFNYIVSHNLRSPIANIIGMKYILDFEQDIEKRNQIYDYIITSVTNLDVIIKDLNTILSAKSLLNEKVELFTVSDIIDSVLGNLDTQIFDSKANISVSIADDSKTFVSIKSYIQSIFYNLISNAIKYRSKTRNPIIKVDVYTLDKNIIIEVMDNGIGIDLNKYQSQLFGLYKRFSKDTEGKGIGLNLTKTQISSLGGTIEVESKLDTFTKFKVILKQN